MNPPLSQEEANTALAILGQKHGVQDLELEPETLSTSLAFGEQGLIVFQYTPSSGLILWSPLQSLDLAESAAAERALLKFLLLENSPTGSMSPSTLAIDEDGRILLKRHLSLHAANLDGLADETHQFAQQVEALSARLATMEWSSTGAEDRLSLEPKLNQETLIRI